MLYACMNEYLIDSLVPRLSLKLNNVTLKINLREILQHEIMSYLQIWRFKAGEHAPIGKLVYIGHKRTPELKVELDMYLISFVCGWVS